MPQHPGSKYTVPSDFSRTLTLTELQPLSALTKLEVEGVAGLSMEGIAALTGLHGLWVGMSQPLRMAALMQLSALRTLTQLHLQCQHPTHGAQHPEQYPLVNEVRVAGGLVRTQVAVQAGLAVQNVQQSCASIVLFAPYAGSL